MTEKMDTANSIKASKKSRIIAATFAILPLAISGIPWGILCGTLAIEAGLNSLQAQLMSLLMFAGAAQLSGIAILGAGGSWLSLINSTSMINVRYLLYSAVFKEEIIKLPLYKRLLFAFILNDFMFAVAQAEQLKSGRFDYAYSVTAGLVFYIIWNLATFVGIFLASLLNNINSLGFDFAIAATFIAMILPMIKTKALLIGIIVSAIVAYMFAYFDISNGLIFSALIGMTIGAMFSKWGNDNKDVNTATSDDTQGGAL